MFEPFYEKGVKGQVDFRETLPVIMNRWFGRVIDMELL